MIGFASLVPAIAGWSDNHMGGGGWMWLWGAFMVLFWLSVIGVIVWAVIRGQHHHQPSSSEHARGILAERLARGEIEPEEYNERLGHLR